MARRTRLSDDEVRLAAQRIRNGETWRAVADDYEVDRRDLSRHFRLLGLDYQRRFYKAHGRTLTIPRTVAERAYLAGLLDGEGSLVSQNGGWSVAITNTHRPVIEWLLRYGGKDTAKTRRDASHRPAWVWRVHAQQDVLALLKSLRPYLIIKRDRAERVIAEIRARPYRR